MTAAVDRVITRNLVGKTRVTSNEPHAECLGHNSSPIGKWGIVRTRVFSPRKSFKPLSKKNNTQPKTAQSAPRNVPIKQTQGYAFSEVGKIYRPTKDGHWIPGDQTRKIHQYEYSVMHPSKTRADKRQIIITSPISTLDKSKKENDAPASFFKNSPAQAKAGMTLVPYSGSAAAEKRRLFSGSNRQSLVISTLNNRQMIPHETPNGQPKTRSSDNRFPVSGYTKPHLSGDGPVDLDRNNTVSEGKSHSFEHLVDSKAFGIKQSVNRISQGVMGTISERPNNSQASGKRTVKEIVEEAKRDAQLRHKIELWKTKARIANTIVLEFHQPKSSGQQNLTPKQSLQFRTNKSDLSTRNMEAEKKSQTELSSQRSHHSTPKSASLQNLHSLKQKQRSPNESVLMTPNEPITDYGEVDNTVFDTLPPPPPLSPYEIQSQIILSDFPSLPPFIQSPDDKAHSLTNAGILPSAVSPMIAQKDTEGEISQYAKLTSPVALTPTKHPRIIKVRRPSLKTPLTSTVSGTKISNHKNVEILSLVPRLNLMESVKTVPTKMQSQMPEEETINMSKLNSPRKRKWSESIDSHTSPVPDADISNYVHELLQTISDEAIQAQDINKPTLRETVSTSSPRNTESQINQVAPVSSGMDFCTQDESSPIQSERDVREPVRNDKSIIEDILRKRRLWIANSSSIFGDFSNTIIQDSSSTLNDVLTPPRITKKINSVRTLAKDPAVGSLLNKIKAEHIFAGPSEIVSPTSPGESTAKEKHGAVRSPVPLSQNSHRLEEQQKQRFSVQSSPKDDGKKQQGSYWELSSPSKPVRRKDSLQSKTRVTTSVTKAQVNKSHVIATNTSDLSKMSPRDLLLKEIRSRREPDSDLS